VLKSVSLVASFLIGLCLVCGFKSNTEMEKEIAVLPTQEPAPLKGVELSPFGKTANGDEVTLIACSNANGNSMRLINYGAAMVSLELPDRDGKRANVILTCPDIAGFEACGSYFNAIAGRYCNRIAYGKFSIGDRQYQLAANNGEHHLHGGVRGFDKRMWTFEPFSDDSGVGVRFTYVSPDGEEGYPGELTVNTTYTLTNKDELIVEITAKTDASTPVNLTNHNYWNLSGSGSILDHELQLFSSKYLPVDAGGIPLGQLAAVQDTPFDFRKSHAIRRDFDQFAGEPGGIDHCFVVDGDNGKMRLAARLHDPKSGRGMEIETTEPGIQFYTGNFLDGTAGSGGYQKNGALCLETEHFPDSPNQKDFPTTILEPGSTYFHRTIHRFGVMK